MKTSNGHVGLVGGSLLTELVEARCAEQSLTLCCYPLDPPPELARLRQAEALVVAADERPLLGVAECGRLRSAFSDLPLALLAPAGAELEAAAERIGALFLPCESDLQGSWGKLQGSVAARRAEAARRAQSWVSERLCIDRTRRVLYVDGEERLLSAAKFDLFSYLLDNAGRAVSARELVQRGLLLPSQALRYKGLIAELRHHLGSDRGCIRAVPGYGYRLELSSRAAADEVPEPGAGGTFDVQNVVRNVKVEPRTPTAARPG